MDDEVLYDFYASRLPDSVCGGAELSRWLRQQPAAEKALFLSSDDLMREDAILRMAKEEKEKWSSELEKES